MQGRRVLGVGVHVPPQGDDLFVNALFNRVSQLDKLRAEPWDCSGSQGPLRGKAPFELFTEELRLALVAEGLATPVAGCEESGGLDDVREDGSFSAHVSAMPLGLVGGDEVGSTLHSVSGVPVLG